MGGGGVQIWAFLVADLLLLGEDEVGGDDGHEEDCHENKGEEPRREDVETADEEAGVARFERFNVESAAIVGTEGLELCGELFDVGIEGFVAGFEVFESFKHGIVFERKSRGYRQCGSRQVAGALPPEIPRAWGG